MYDTFNLLRLVVTVNEIVATVSECDKYSSDSVILNE